MEVSMLSKVLKLHYEKTLGVKRGTWVDPHGRYEASLLSLRNICKIRTSQHEVHALFGSCVCVCVYEDITEVFTLC